MAEAGHRESPGLVILVFSRIAKTLPEWNDLTSATFAKLSGWVKESHNIADVEVMTGSSTNSTSEAHIKGRVYKLQGHISSSADKHALNLEECHQLRQEQSIQDLEKNHAVEVIVQPVDLFIKHQTPGLAVFDMDSTLIQQEVIDEIARAVGKYDEVAAVTEAAMRGEIDFETSLRQRVAKLKGVSTDIWERMKTDVVTLSPGALSLTTVLRNLGWKTALLSGGFTPLAYWLRDTLKLDYAFANQLATDAEGKHLSGELVLDAPIIHAEAKRHYLLQLAEENGIPIAKTIAVGDGSNDLLMMKAAGLGIAFNAKPKVQEAAPARLNTDSLLDIMHVLGYNKQEIGHALKGSPANETTSES